MKNSSLNAMSEGKQGDLDSSKLDSYPKIKNEPS